MRKRQRIPRKKSRQSFTKNAVKTHRKNISGAPMRGGIRL